VTKDSDTALHSRAHISERINSESLRVPPPTFAKKMTGFDPSDSEFIRPEMWAQAALDYTYCTFSASFVGQKMPSLCNKRWHFFRFLVLRTRHCTVNRSRQKVKYDPQSEKVASSEGQ
jgi:hypothetical protein